MSARLSRAGKDEGWIGQHVRKQQVSLLSFFDGVKMSLVPTQGQEVASADILESLLIIQQWRG